MRSRAKLILRKEKATLRKILAYGHILNGVEIRVHGTGMLPLFTMTPTIFSFAINPDDPPLLMKMQDIDGEGYKRELMSVFVPFDTDCRTFLVAHDQNDEIMVSHTCAGLQL